MCALQPPANKIASNEFLVADKNHMMRCCMCSVLHLFCMDNIDGKPILCQFIIVILRAVEMAVVVAACLANVGDLL